MKIILLERIQKLGQMGDTVSVRPGYARNFLLPQGKALRATEVNKKRFEDERVQLEARNLERKTEAQVVADKLEGQRVIIIRQAGETGQLYGSVSSRDIATSLGENGFTVTHSQVTLNRPIKSIGLHDVIISLHPEVGVEVIVNVARTQDEAGRQDSGEDLTKRDDDFEFEPGDFDNDDEDDDDTARDNDDMTSDNDENISDNESDDAAIDAPEKTSTDAN